MNKIVYSFSVVIITFLTLGACKDDDVLVFEKAADERVAEAIASLKADLTAPANGWKVKYTPEAESGSFYVLLKFDANNNVNIKSDLGTNNGEFYDQTIKYRIDNSLGLELVLENYSFFSFLFEQDQATFQAEFEFDYVNKTPDNALVFKSKTDTDVPTILVFEPAAATDNNLLGTTLSSNLKTMADDFDKFSSSLTLTYLNKDLVFYLSLDEARRVLNISAASRKTGQNAQNIGFTTGYLIKGDSIVFNTLFNRSVLGNTTSIKGIKLNELKANSINICAQPITIHSYQGVASSNDLVTLETSLADAKGGTFHQVSNFYFSPLNFILDNGNSVGTTIREDIAGAIEMHLYYNVMLQDGSTLYGIGFVIQNPDESITFALRKFTPELVNNKIKFNFEEGITLFGNQQTNANLDNINKYLEKLTEGDNTYIFEIRENIYEFYNPCSGWSFPFINGNQ